MDRTDKADSHHNPILLVVASALRAALFPIPVITLFWKDEIGLSLADIMWLQAIFGATAVLTRLSDPIPPLWRCAHFTFLNLKKCFSFS